MQTNSPWIHASKTLACKHTGKGKSQQGKEDGKTKNNNTREVGIQLGSWPSWPAHPHNIENKHDVSTKPCPQRKPVQNWKRTEGGITMEQAESEGNRERWNDYHGCPSWNHSCGPWSCRICGKFLSLHRLAQNRNGRKLIHSSFLHLQGLVFVMGHSSCPSPTHISLANSRSMSPTAEPCTSGLRLHQQCHSAQWGPQMESNPTLVL